jgi:hypothetical protein
MSATAIRRRVPLATATDADGNPVAWVDAVGSEVKLAGSGPYTVLVKAPGGS